ncbi:MAG: hypothetical protein WDZ45_02585 [Flavobacteriaceae bacterium]
MKEQETKELERFVAGAMFKTKLETPSPHFTERVIKAVMAEQQATAIGYRPLIPTYMWIGIAFFIVSLTTYLWFLAQPAPFNWPSLSFGFLENNILFKKLAAVSISKITLYAVLFLAVMICVQIPVLKYYFNRRQTT